MKTLVALLMVSLGLCISNLKAQNTALTGAWQLQSGDNLHHVFFQNGFFFHTVQNGKSFVSTRGGMYSIDGNNLDAKILFNSADSSKVGEALQIPFSASSTELSLEVPEGNVVLKRVDDGKAPLAGVWKITGRMGEDGKVAAIHQTGSRQTYKLLTGKKFQWVAIDPEKKQFSGTGGGSYTFKDGKYTENIEFFSRDNSRVGAALTFDGKLENGSWHHSGLSSKGAKIYEVWGKVN